MIVYNKEYKQNFIKTARDINALRFGDFTLKSGRKSPYFFNAGLFSTGESLYKIAECYVDKIIESNISFDILFGPAYKGIPLVSAISIILNKRINKKIPFAFNRKEAKKHGEGGLIVGSDIKGKVLIIDDVMTAGTAVKESISLLKDYNVEISEVLVALDRQEVAPNSSYSATKILKDEYGVNTSSVITLDDLIEYLKKDNDFTIYYDSLKEYRDRFGYNY